MGEIELLQQILECLGALLLAIIVGIVGVLVFLWHIIENTK